MSRHTRRPVWPSVAIVIVLLFVLARPSAAQNVGTVTGTVEDPQGLVTPGATVVLTNRVAQTRQEAIVDDMGRFTFSNVPYGTYVLVASLVGFAPVEQVIDVRSTVPLITHVALRVGGVTETVNIAADALLEASSVGSRVALGATLIEQLPSATPSKQIGSMLLSVPGFIPSQNGRIHVRGSHGQIQYVVDGVSMTDEFSEAFANPLDPQYVKSAAVMTGGIPAEYGNKLAAVVDITSRSGLDAPRRIFGTATLNAGRFDAIDAGVTLGGRAGSRVGYFFSAGGNRTDRYLDPPSFDNFHNSGHAGRFTGKLEFRPSDADFARVVVSANSSRFDVPNPPVAERLTADGDQRLRDNSQTLTWLRQIGNALSFDAVAYRRAAAADLNLSTGVPLAAMQERTLDHQGGSAALSYSRGRHRAKAGVQVDRDPVAEHFSVRASGAALDDAAALFDPRQGGAPFDFDGREVGNNVGLFVQDVFSPVADLNLSLGVRWDRYQLLVTESAISPRLGIAYHVHGTETVIRASYSRLFMPPFSENLLVSSSAEARALSPNQDIGGGTDVRSERQHAFEVGAQQALGRHARLDVSFYRKNIRNVADVDQFRDTTVTFPISVDRGRAQGLEFRLDVPTMRGVNGYVSLSRASMVNIAPFNGGLMLGTPLEPGEEFFADHDKRWQSQFGVSYEHPSRRVFASVTGRFDSGPPFLLPDNFDPVAFDDPLALSLVNLEEGRAKPRTIANVLVGTQVYRHGTTNLELQAGVLNAFDTTHVLNFLSIFNGTHYGPPRTWTARLKVAF
jgi:TonB dependent receptor/Carboxypeptidase regulatory-like domain/TonB-dependent Receptor Plug Domain